MNQKYRYLWFSFVSLCISVGALAQEQEKIPQFGNFIGLRTGYSYFQYPPRTDYHDYNAGRADANGVFLGVSKVDYTYRKASLTYYAGTHLVYGSYGFRSIPEAGIFFSYSTDLIRIDCLACNLINSLGIAVNIYYFEPRIGLNVLDFVDFFVGLGVPFKRRENYNAAVQGITFGANLQLFRFRYRPYSMFKGEDPPEKPQHYEDEFLKKYGQ